MASSFCMWLHIAALQRHTQLPAEGHGAGLNLGSIRSVGNILTKTACWHPSASLLVCSAEAVSRSALLFIGTFKPDAARKSPPDPAQTQEPSLRKSLCSPLCPEEPRAHSPLPCLPKMPLGSKVQDPSGGHHPQQCHETRVLAPSPYLWPWANQPLCALVSPSIN